MHQNSAVDRNVAMPGATPFKFDSEMIERGLARPDPAHEATKRRIFRREVAEAMDAANGLWSRRDMGEKQ